ncbi:DUF6578 domain-containing protein [Streptomyces tricolor]|uniref:DUF6578 domain-containing protein n=1 Tax=Streptomyces tricolor TaxID=68277 RepID=UPI003800B431
MRVFYPDTELECRGTPFAVGDEIAWRPVPADARDELYGAEARVDHHTGPDRETLGRVHAIELVHQQYVVHTDPRLREQIVRARRPDPESLKVVLLPSPYTEVPGVPREAGVAPPPAPGAAVTRARAAATAEHPGAAVEPVGAAPYEPGDRR